MATYFYLLPISHTKTYYCRMSAKDKRIIFFRMMWWGESFFGRSAQRQRVLNFNETESIWSCLLFPSCFIILQRLFIITYSVFSELTFLSNIFLQKNNPFKQNTVQYENSTRKLQDLWIKMSVFVKTVFEW